MGVKLLLLSLPPYLDDMGLVSEPMKSIKIGIYNLLAVVVGVLAVYTSTGVTGRWWPRRWPSCRSTGCTTRTWAWCCRAR